MPTTRRKRANPPDEPDGNNGGLEQQDGNVEPSAQTEQSAAEQVNAAPAPADHAVPPQYTPAPQTQPAPPMNGDRPGTERAEYAPAEPPRRTTFRRVAQQPVQPPPPPAPVAPPPSAPAATHEITQPLGNLLHLAYNPAYTGSEEARSVLLHRLENESKAGGRGRCWNCGSLAIAYDCWNTRSRNLGEIGIAFCEVCGVWSVL